jgi:hypothetical protein
MPCQNTTNSGMILSQLLHAFGGPMCDAPLPDWQHGAGQHKTVIYSTIDGTLHHTVSKPYEHLRSDLQSKQSSA